MTNTIANQYATGLSRNNIERALLDAGKDLDHLTPADLGPLEDFHTMGRFATAQLLELAGITGESRVLDAGSGIGGTARYLADHYGCAVTAVDLTAEYCDTHRWLNRLVGLDASITVALMQAMLSQPADPLGPACLRFRLPAQGRKPHPGTGRRTPAGDPRCGARCR
ncbi:SAM-dependent methyltransferase [Mycobacterium sp. M23085]|uniref:SAM-dependent methyltransferase n=1 Tax=Mycobacterium sp. M23085 TaxID=3378087 RepID=UPI003877B0E2